MIAVYSDSQILDLEWIPYLNFGDCHVYKNIQDYACAVADHKFAFTMHRLHCEQDAYLTFEDKINQLSALSNLVFTFESELHHYHWQMWERCHRPNVYWVLPGQVNDSAMNNNIIFWGDWFKTTALVYKQLPNKLAQLDPYNTNKPRYFDALLGSPKPHRDFVCTAVKQNNLQDQFIMPYGGVWDDNSFYAKDYFMWEPGVEVVGEQQPGTAGPVKYYGVPTGLSRVIPIQVFNDTYYSIVAETDHDNTLSFFSEKTAKPMIARRVFVAFSGYKFLYNLRSQGFQTFGTVIDERYDDIKDDHERYTAAFEQVQRLCTMEAAQVLDRVRPVLEYNYQRIMSTNWTAFSYRRIQSLLDIKLAHSC
jgi:hypothetical protein